MAKRVLVCEDNPVNRVLIRDILAVDGYEVIEAVDGAEGVELASSFSPNLIVMDIQMPIMNGYDAIMALRLNMATASIPIIAITSFAMLGDREKVLEAGADEYLSKPIDTRQFRALAKRMLGDR